MSFLDTCAHYLGIAAMLAILLGLVLVAYWAVYEATIALSKKIFYPRWVAEIARFAARARCSSCRDPKAYVWALMEVLREQEKKHPELNGLVQDFYCAHLLQTHVPKAELDQLYVQIDRLHDEARAYRNRIADLEQAKS